MFVLNFVLTLNLDSAVAIILKFPLLILWQLSLLWVRGVLWSVVKCANNGRVVLLLCHAQLIIMLHKGETTMCRPTIIIGGRPAGFVVLLHISLWSVANSPILLL